MYGKFYLSACLIISGIVIFGLSLIRGEGGIFLFFVFPVFYSTSLLGGFGIFLIFVGIFILFFMPFFSSFPRFSEPPNEVEHVHHDNEKRSHYGGVVLIGPIPIIFGSDKHIAFYMIIAAISMLLALYLFIYYFVLH